MSKLFFRPDKFIDKNGKEIQFKDIEIEELSPEACQCGCDSATLNLKVKRYLHGPFEVNVMDIEELQSIIENAWDSASIPEMLFKQKNSDYPRKYLDTNDNKYKVKLSDGRVIEIDEFYE